ncbi:MAG: DUF4956 domain-containing protein [Lentisphaerae bacterium]|jgi:hypothetical protein|nr:DUF4956 domain-containing protein [Lentisphaerota bacterium]
MKELLLNITDGAGFTLDLRGFLLCLVLSIAAAWIVELMYVIFYDNKATGSQIHRGFVLIGPSITLLFICVQLSLPLSLGLLGSLSIVRFRTPIKEPEEIGFLMLLIAGSIGIATFNFLFIALLYLASFVVLALRNWTRVRGLLLKRREGVLMVNLAEEAYREHGAELDRRLAGHFRGLRVESIASSAGTTSIQYVFKHLASGAWSEVQKDLHADIPLNKINVFFSRPAEAH